MSHNTTEPDETPPTDRTVLLTPDQLAERWQVSKSQIWRLAREDRIPVVRVGRYPRFRLDLIEAWERDSGRTSDV